MGMKPRVKTLAPNQQYYWIRKRKSDGLIGSSFGYQAPLRWSSDIGQAHLFQTKKDAIGYWSGPSPFTATKVVVTVEEV